MFEIFATIACVLILTGGLSVTYFAKYFKDNKDIFLWTVMLESVMTVLIGILYIYGAILWSNNIPARYQIINNIDDLAVINNTFYNTNEELFNELQQLLTLEEMHNLQNVSDADNKIEDTRENHNFNLNYDFYQYVLEFIINQKKKDTTRKSKQIQMIEAGMSETDEIEYLFMKTFLQQILLVYSFLHCVMILVNYSTFYCNYIPEIPLETGTSSIEKVKVLEPTDQLFEKRQVIDNTEPPVHLFNVKMDTEAQKNNQRNVTNFNKTPNLKKQIFQMLTGILFLIILTVILYSILRMVSSNLPLNTAANKYNFNASIVNSNDLQKLIHNINDDKEQEMDKIVKKIYNLIGTVKSTNSNIKHITAPKEYLRYQNVSQDYNDNVQQNVYIKVYNFIVFIMVYVIVLLYMNNLQAKFVTNNKKPFSKCIILFAMLWLPTILEMFYRTYIVNKSPNILSGLLLLLGNGNTITQTLQKYAQWTGYTKQNPTVEPLHK